MKTNQRNISVILVLALLGLLTWHWFRQFNPDEHSPTKAAETNASAGRSIAVPRPIPSGAIPDRPRLFRATNYPPATPEEMAMWDWWRAMEKSDPLFEWKMPIEFYGKVVDQFGQPVGNATASMIWTTLPDTERKETRTTADGRFALLGARGKRLGIIVAKEGYVKTRQSHLSFEYAAFHEEEFHVADPNNPVVFRLQKLLGSEPMYVFSSHAEFLADGSPLWFDMVNGKLGASGHFGFSVELGERRNERGPDHKIIVVAQSGSGLALSEEEFSFLAPEEGYEAKHAFDEHITYASIFTKTFKFYGRTEQGKHGLVGVTISVPRFGNKVLINCTVTISTNGSRNLEFDHRKWINR